MWTCHKCGKPVYFAERKQSLGFDWHPNCLRCEECGKRLNPGQHAEHKGVPYCHIPCYGALFGPQLFGHGTRVESHTSFGKVENKPPSVNRVPRTHLESKLKAYNQYYDGRSGELKCREVNKRLVLEGVLHIYWGVNNLIQLKEEDDQRMVVVIRKRNSYRRAISNGLEDDSDSDAEGGGTDADKGGGGGGEAEGQPPRSMDWDELGRLLHVEDGQDGEVDDEDEAKRSKNDFWVKEPIESDEDTESAGATTSPPQQQTSPPPHQPSTAIRRRPGRRMCRSKLRRRCSINGHFYNRETSVFTPPYGSHMSVWVTSLVGASDVISLLLDKYKVESKASDFALFVVRENGERRRLRDDEYPLVVRVMLGPHEDIARIFLMDSTSTREISSQVAQYINLSETECRSILGKFQEEEEREVQRVRLRFREMKKRIKQRMDELKVRL